MILLKVTNASHVNRYRLNLSFNDGLTAIVDLKDKIFSDQRAIFLPLRDIAFFKNFTKNSFTIEWENGLDLAPEFLYDLALNSKLD